LSDVHPGLQRPEVWPARLVERHDLPVQHGRLIEQLAEGGKIRVALRHVPPIAGDQPDCAIPDVGDHAHATASVPLQLGGERVRIRRQ
jgi:hypothetical protein